MPCDPPSLARPYVVHPRQMVSRTRLLLAHQGASAAGGVPPALLDAAGAAGVPLLCVAAFLTVYSLADYFRGLWRFF